MFRFVLISTKLTKLCFFKHDNSTVFTLFKILSTNNREGSVSVIRTKKHNS